MLDWRQIGMSCHHQKLLNQLLTELLTLHKLGLQLLFPHFRVVSQIPSFPRSIVEPSSSLLIIRSILLYKDRTRFTVHMCFFTFFSFLIYSFFFFFYFMITTTASPSFTTAPSQNCTFQNFIIDQTNPSTKIQIK